MLLEVEQVESVTSGLIHDGEAYQVDHNIKENKLSEEVLLIVRYVEAEEGL